MTLTSQDYCMEKNAAECFHVISLQERRNTVYSVMFEGRGLSDEVIAVTQEKFVWWHHLVVTLQYYSCQNLLRIHNSFFSLFPTTLLNKRLPLELQWALSSCGTPEPSTLTGCGFPHKELGDTESRPGGLVVCETLSCMPLHSRPR